MSAPLKTPSLSGGTGAVAGKAHVESGRREAIGGVFPGRRRDLEAQLGGACAGGVEADERAAALVFLRREEKAARRDEIERFRGLRDEDEDSGASERQRLLARPQRVDLRLCAREKAAPEIEPELRQTLRIRNAVLSESVLGRGEEQEPVFRPLRESEREGERRHLLPRRGRRRLDKAEPRAGAKVFKGRRARERDAGETGNGGGGDHGKS